MKKIKIFILIILLGNILTTYSQVNNAKMQAVFIYNYTKLVLWPEDYRSGDFVIGVIGTGEIVSELENMAKTKKAGNQNIVIKKYSSGDEVGKCHILLITASQSSKIAPAVSNTNKFSTLIVTDSDGAISKGSCINFFIESGKQKFEVSESNASKRGLKLSNDLVKLSIKK